MLKQVFTAVSPVLKSVGKSLDAAGAALEVVATTESLVPSTRLASYKGVAPAVAGSFVAPNSTVLGNVTVGTGSSVWYGAKIRGDVNHVKIGSNTSIGDNAMVHVAKIAGDAPCLVGDNVTVGPNAIIHACTIESNCIVGMGAQVLDGAKLETNSIVAPGAVVTPRTVVASGQLWAGCPAKHLRDLTDEEVASITASATATTDLALAHAEECDKTYEQVEEAFEDYEDSLHRHPDYYPKLPKGGLEEDAVLGQGSPGLIFNSKLSPTPEGSGPQGDQYDKEIPK